MNTGSIGLLVRSLSFQSYNSEHIPYIIKFITLSKMDMPTNFEVQVQAQQKGN